MATEAEFDTLAVIIATPGRGRTAIQWRIPDGDTQALTAEFSARLGVPVLESIVEPGVLDRLQDECAGGGIVHVSG